MNWSTVSRNVGYALLVDALFMFFSVLIALFGGWIWQTVGIETLFIISAVLGLCNSAYAATSKTRRQTD